MKVSNLSTNGMLSGLNSRRICSTTNSVSSIIIISSCRQDDTEIHSILLFHGLYIYWRESYDRKMTLKAIVKNTAYCMDWFLFVSMLDRITARVLKVSDHCKVLCAIHRNSHYNLIVRFSPASVLVCARYIDAS